MNNPDPSLKCLAAKEAQNYGLTSTETDVWLLHRANYTYKQIAAELHLTPNVVKKYMKSIHLKQQAVLEIKE